MTHCDERVCGSGPATDEKVSGLRKLSGARAGGGEGGATASWLRPSSRGGWQGTGDSERAAQHVARAQRGGYGGGAVTSIVRDARRGEGQAASGGGEGGGADGVQYRGRRLREAAVGAAHHVARPRRAGVRRRRPPEGHVLRAREGRPGGGQRRCAVRRQGEACGDAAAAPSRASRAGEKGGRPAVVGRAAARTTCSTEGDERRRPAAAPRSTWPGRGVCGCDGGAVSSATTGARGGNGGWRAAVLGRWDGGKCGENCASYSQGEHGGVVRVAGRGARGDEYQKEDGSGNG